MTWIERIFYFCDTRSVDDENRFLIKCRTWTHITSELQNICYNTNLPNILIHKKYGDLEMLLFKLLHHKEKNSTTNHIIPYPCFLLKIS